MSLYRDNAVNLNSVITAGIGKIALPSYCDLVNSGSSNKDYNSSFFNWDDLENCTNKILTVQVSLHI